MIYLFFFLCFSCLNAAEINWQGQQEDCEVSLQFSSDTIELLQPLTIEAVLKCPPSYEVDINLFKEKLLQSANNLDSDIFVEIFESSIQKNTSKNTYKVLFQLYLTTVKIYLLTFLDIEFISSQPDISNQVIYTPVMKIKAIKEENVPLLVSAPLLDSEPQLFLSLSAENQQFLASQEEQAQVEAENLRIIQTHQFPWWVLLSASIFLFLGYILNKYRKKIFAYFHNKQAMPINQLLKKRLEQIKNSYKQRVDEKEVYLELSEVCADYLFENFGLNINYYSLQEIEQKINELPLSLNLKSQLMVFLKGIFYLKFANQKIIEPSFEAAFKLVTNLIDSSKEAVKPTECEYVTEK